MLSHESADSREMITGQLVQGVVSSIDKARKVVHLSSDPDMLAKCVVRSMLWWCILGFIFF